VLPFDWNSCCGLGSPVCSRPVSFATSGRVDGFTCHSKLPFLSLTTIELLSVSETVMPSCEVGVSNDFVSRSV
jgi:hypothetical protein